jgi:hypothetical protein
MERMGGGIVRGMEPEILTYASPHRPNRGRSLPQWAWLIAYLLFPLGPFIALAVAKVISWRNAVILAVVSYGTGAGMTWLMISLEDSPNAGLRQIIGGVVPLVFFLGWSMVIYYIGRAADYWHPRTRRLCVILFWIALSLLMVDLLMLGLRFFLNVRAHL